MPQPDNGSRHEASDKVDKVEPLDSRDFINLLTARFSTLSPQLQRAARFVIDNPGDIAVHSMRSIAKRAGVQHNAMVRLAREFGFDGYDQFRDLFRDSVTREADDLWLDRARSIRERFPVGSDSEIVGEYLLQETQNLQRTFGEETAKSLNVAIERLREANKIYVLGVRSMFALAYYFHYTWRMFDTRTILLTGLGGAFADDLRNIRDSDVVVVFSQHPYATAVVAAVKFARRKGAQIVCITDSAVAPVVGDGDITLIASNNAVSLFPTLVPAMSIAQILATMALSEGSEQFMETLKDAQDQLRGFGVYERY